MGAHTLPIRNVIQACRQTQFAIAGIDAGCWMHLEIDESRAWAQCSGRLISCVAWLLPTCAGRGGRGGKAGFSGQVG